MGEVCFIGLDYGTESARAVLVSARGEILATAVCPYPDGVIDDRLPGTDVRLGTDWALQNPADWLKAIEVTIPQVLQAAGVAGDQVLGLGIAFTACTPLPTTSDGTPLCDLERWRRAPHAWPKLWKHHAAQRQADRMNQIAAERRERFVERYGGVISSEWLLPKALQVLDEAPEVYEAAARFIEGGDWVAWQLTGQERRNACAAGYKACWSREDGYPPAAYLAALAPGFGPGISRGVEEKLSSQIVPPGAPVGTLTPDWAARLRLPQGTAVGAAMIDAHAGALGAGLSAPETLAMVMGTSTCHLLLSTEPVTVQGISGIVEDGIVPGFFAYEAGQAGVGDIFAWFVEQGLPAGYRERAQAAGVSAHQLLSDLAAAHAPGQSGLLALDWWNGCRTPLVDAGLSGAILGYTLATTPEEIYRALIEATAYGTRLVIETFTNQGVDVDRIVATGGLTKNRLLMQIYADVTGREIAVASTELATALGAAMLGATAAGKSAGGYEDLPAAVAAMSGVPAASYRPELAAQAPYDILYREYVRLVDLFGRDHHSTLHVLKRLRSGSTTLA